MKLGILKEYARSLGHIHVESNEVHRTLLQHCVCFQLLLGVFCTVHHSSGFRLSTIQGLCVPLYMEGPLE
jgi:hypothetical protein